MSLDIVCQGGLSEEEIIKQLIYIYENFEWWHKTRMSYSEAIHYHKKCYDNGNIHIYEEHGEVLGYYQRYFKDDTCILYNLYIKPEYRQGRIFKELYRHFFKTMPNNIKYITGEKVKLGGKFQKVLISKERKNGVNKD